jgi:pimeloyl-ACP methyl ester carboxylesterase
MAMTRSRPSLAYALSGPAAAPVLVFVNGLGGAKEAWFYQVRHFRSRYRVLVFDNRGAGKSESRDAPTTMADFSDDLLRLLNQLGLHRVTLVGISFGGRVAQQFALRHPDRLEALVLVGTDCGAGGQSRPHAALRRAPDLDEQGWLDQVVPVLFGPKYIREQSKRLEVFARSRANQVPDPVGTRWQWHAYESFDACDQLGQIRTPTLVLHGEHDALSPLSAAERLASSIPGARLQVLRQVGHSPNVENPSAFNAAIERFLLR